MEKLDANSILLNSQLKSHICIIGGGAAGISIAKQLANTDKDVLLLESGVEHFDIQTQSLYEFTSSGHKLRSQSGYISRNRYLGGSTNTWMGQCAPLDELDFKKRDWIPNSGWPIPKEELEPYYIEAAELLNLPPYSNFKSTKWFKYLLNKSSNFFEQGKILPSSFLLGKRPCNMRTNYLQTLISSQNIQIITHANVTNIECDNAGEEVSNIEVKTLKGNSFIVKADIFILCCGGLENARILLSSNKQNPEGLGNKHDVLGRYYMEHPKIMSGKIYPLSKTLRSPILLWKKKIDKKGYLRIYLKLSEKILSENKLPNNCIEITYPHSLRESVAFSEKFLSNLKISKSKIHELVKLAPHIFRILESLERILLNLPVKFDYLLINNHIEQIPKASSRVTLGDEVDALGMKKLNIHLDINTLEKQTMIEFHNVLNEILLSENIARIESEFPKANEEWPGLTDSSHHIGTTRMSDSPESGVVDKNCKVHGINNLYVVGSSVFPTGGHVNPTLTIVAMALRLAARLRTNSSVSS